MYIVLVYNRVIVCLRPVWEGFCLAKGISYSSGRERCLSLEVVLPLYQVVGTVVFIKLQVFDSSPAPTSVWKGQLISEVINFKVTSSLKLLNNLQTGKVTDEGEKKFLFSYSCVEVV